MRTGVFNQCTLPVLTYGSQPLTMTKAHVDKIMKAQRTMERKMIQISLKEISKLA